MIYAGIGARETPHDVLHNMSKVGKVMASWGHTLRSGGADGADAAFETGCDLESGTKEIYLPFEMFRKNTSKLFGTTKEARLLARQFHPNWDNLGDTARDFMGRNAYQILGLDLRTPVDLVLCWTRNGKVTGGTGQALRMCIHYNIPVMNFASMTLEEISEGLLNL